MNPQSPMIRITAAIAAITFPLTTSAWAVPSQSLTDTLRTGSGLEETTDPESPLVQLAAAFGVRLPARTAGLEEPTGPGKAYLSEGILNLPSERQWGQNQFLQSMARELPDWFRANRVRVGGWNGLDLKFEILVATGDPGYIDDKWSYVVRVIDSQNRVLGDIDIQDGQFLEGPPFLLVLDVTPTPLGTSTTAQWVGPAVRGIADFSQGQGRLVFAARHLQQEAYGQPFRPDQWRVEIIPPPSWASRIPDREWYAFSGNDPIEAEWVKGGWPQRFTRRMRKEEQAARQHRRSGLEELEEEELVPGTPGTDSAAGLEEGRDRQLPWLQLKRLGLQLRQSWLERQLKKLSSKELEVLRGRSANRFSAEMFERPSVSAAIPHAPQAADLARGMVKGADHQLETFMRQRDALYERINTLKDKIAALTADIEARSRSRELVPVFDKTEADGLERVFDAIDVPQVRAIMEPIDVYIDPAVLEDLPGKQLMIQLGRVMRGWDALDGASKIHIYMKPEDDAWFGAHRQPVLRIIEATDVSPTGWTLALENLGTQRLPISALPLLILKGLGQRDQALTVDVTPYLSLHAVTLQAVFDRLAGIFA